MRGLLEDDVLGRAEHPVREVAGLELRQRHREADPHVLDPAQPPGPHPVEQADEGGVVEVVVVDPQGEPLAVGEAPGAPGTSALDRAAGFSTSDADPHLQELAGHRHVEVRRHQDVGDVDLQVREAVDRGDGVRHPPLPGGAAGPLGVGVADRRQLDLGHLGQDVAVELRHVARADQGDAQVLARRRAGVVLPGLVACARRAQVSAQRLP